MMKFEDVNAVLRYDPASGNLCWKARGPRRRIGRIAGSAAYSGHIRVGLFGRPTMAHVLIWLLMTGEWPDREIDHIDGNPANNRWDNLRLATRFQNAKNRKRGSNNTSGFKGVARWKNKWKAEIMADGKSRYLGLYDTPQDAHRAYADAAHRLHGEFARLA